MNSPESFIRLRITPVSLSILFVLSYLLLFSSVDASPLPHNAAPPPPPLSKSSSSTPLASTATHHLTTSSTPPPSLSPSSSSHLHPTPLSSSSTAIHTPSTQPPVASWTSSSVRPTSPTILGSRMPLARMLSLVFVSILFVVLVISFIWYFWRKQWLANRQQQSQPLSDDGWLRIDERGQVVRDDASHQPPQPYQPSMLSYMAPSPTPAALTISYQPHVDVSSERQFVRF